jgi:hypothetical protein
VPEVGSRLIARRLLPPAKNVARQDACTVNVNLFSQRPDWEHRLHRQEE